MTRKQWRTIKIGEICQETRTRVGEQSLPVYSVTKHAGFVANYFKKDVHSKDRTKYKMVEKGDFAYATIHLDEGSIGISPELAAISPMYTTFRLIAPEKVDPHYLLLFLKSKQAMAHYQLLGTGSVERRKNIKFNSLGKLKVPLPPLEEQRRIATILEKANSLRNAPRRTEVHINNIVSQFVENRLLRSNKKFVKLSELCDIQSGITKGRKTKKALAAKIPYLAVSNVKDGYLDLSKVKEIEVTNQEKEKYALHKGDILLTEGGDPDKLGRGCLWNDEIPNCLHQNHIFRVRLKDKQTIPANVLMAILSSKELKTYFFKSAKQTTGIASINRTQLSNAPIPILDNETIAEIDCLLYTCEKLMATNTSRTLLLDELIQSLSARAFNGQL